MCVELAVVDHTEMSLLLQYLSNRFDAVNLASGAKLTASKRLLKYCNNSLASEVYLQCFDTVGWATGRASGL